MKFLFPILASLLPVTVLQSEPKADGLVLIEHVKKCIEQAAFDTSNLSVGVLEIDGMSSSKVRHLLNNLCSLPQTSYLEIGCWKGSTFVSALENNDSSIIQAVAIDDWSEFDGPRNDFFSNLHRFIKNQSPTILEADCFTINKQTAFPLPVNIYFYDGNHEAASQEMAFTYFDDVLDDLFIAVVDDWNESKVKKGTRTAFYKLRYEILFEQELRTPCNGDFTSWWNGIYVAVIQKKCSP